MNQIHTYIIFTAIFLSFLLFFVFHFAYIAKLNKEIESQRQINKKKEAEVDRAINILKNTKYILDDMYWSCRYQYSSKVRADTPNTIKPNGGRND